MDKSVKLYNQYFCQLSSQASNMVYYYNRSCPVLLTAKHLKRSRVYIGLLVLNCCIVLSLSLSLAVRHTHSAAFSVADVLLSVCIVCLTIS